jgi:hypothetical protein
VDDAVQGTDHAARVAALPDVAAEDHACVEEASEPSWWSIATINALPSEASIGPLPTFTTCDL